MKERLKKLGCDADYIYVSRKVNGYAIAYLVLHYSVTNFMPLKGQGMSLL